MNIWQKLRQASGLSFEEIKKKTGVPINTLKNIESRLDKKKLNPDYVCELSKFYSTLSGCVNYDTEYHTLMQEAGYKIPKKYFDHSEKVKLSSSENKVVQSFNGTNEEKEFIRLILFVMKNKRELLEIFEDPTDFENYIAHKAEFRKWFDET